ncbi:MAG: DUF2971 domain-containing protein [Candidatus Cloacimonetes bacterium]|nr:DUF2971 domain-containing protein [Candidatus Cloacimonadota bacterium]
MWSHYAKNHSGICIEYDFTDCDVYSPKKVVYDGSRPNYCNFQSG